VSTDVRSWRVAAFDRSIARTSRAWQNSKKKNSSEIEIEMRRSLFADIDSQLPECAFKGVPELENGELTVAEIDCDMVTLCGADVHGDNRIRCADALQRCSEPLQYPRVSIPCDTKSSLLFHREQKKLLVDDDANSERATCLARVQRIRHSIGAAIERLAYSKTDNSNDNNDDNRGYDGDHDDGDGGYSADLESESLFASIGRGALESLGRFVGGSSMHRENRCGVLLAPKRCPIRAMAWHQSRRVLALVAADDAVRLFSLDGNRGEWQPLTLFHEKQRNVECIEWRPADDSLAIGCADGVCVWNVFRRAADDAASPAASSAAADEWASASAWMHFLSRDGHAPVNALAWMPVDGSLLASGSRNDSTLLLWQVATATATPLRRMGAGIAQLHWSPDGARLVSTTTARMFRVWQTSTWTCQRWSHLSAPVATAAWSPDASQLAFGVVGESQLYTMRFDGANGQARVARVDSLRRHSGRSELTFSVRCVPIPSEPADDAELAVREFLCDRLRLPGDSPASLRIEPSPLDEHCWRVFCPTLHRFVEQRSRHDGGGDDVEPPIGGSYRGFRVSLDGAHRIAAGGAIRQLAWDERGERLAVTFAGNLPGAELIAIIATHGTDYTPIGVVRGAATSRRAHFIAWQPTRQLRHRGAVLSCAWLDGALSFHPFYFS
jgi:Anaphase-promoting complex subunit 4 WD40 domain/WD domain, G-beta repeat